MAGWAGLALLGAFVVLAAIGPDLAPYRVTELAGDPLTPPDRHHWVGTNSVGQDIGSQLAAGARTSLVVALIGGGATLALGAAVGVAAGWFGGMADELAMRTADLVLIVPTVPLLVVLSAYTTPGTLGLCLIIAVTSWPLPARVVRSEALSLRRRNYVEAAVSFGAGSGHVLRRHILPGVGFLLVAGLVSAAERAVAIEAGLAFLGLVNSSQTSWGSIMRDALDFRGLFFTDAWRWWLLPPILAVSLLLLAIALVGTSIEHRLNPRLATHRSV
jgi:ABC-type dipeptide/oligopeptide/nickel transport system permease subunit